jgi:hypothetical protein
VSGIDVEKKCGKALADAHRQVFHENLTWYFLYGADWGARAPPVEESLRA